MSNFENQRRTHKNGEKRTNVLKSENVSRETLDTPHATHGNAQADDIVIMEHMQSDALPASPSFKQLYNRFRSGKLSVPESAFNAAYLYCNDRYYSSGAEVKDKYRNIYAHPDMWYKNASDLWRHNKWSVVVALLGIIPSAHRFGVGICKGFGVFKAKCGSLWQNLEYSHVAVKTIWRVVTSVMLVCASLAFGIYGTYKIVELTRLTPVLGVYVDGQYAGNALSISEVETAKKTFDETMSVTLRKSYRLDSEVKYIPELAQNGDYTSLSALGEVFQSVAKENMRSGYGLYVDGKLIGVSPYGEWIETAISDSLDVEKTKLTGDGVEFVDADYNNKVTTLPGKFPEQMFLELSEVRALFGLRYVTNADMGKLSEGAQHFGGHDAAHSHASQTNQGEIVVDAEALSAEQDNSVPSYVTDLDNITAYTNTQEYSNTITLSVAIEKTLVEKQKIPFETREIADKSLMEGRATTVSRGVDGVKEVTYKVAYVGGIERSRMIVSENIISEPVTAVIKRGTRPMTDEEKRVASTGTYIWPCPESKRLSSDYGWRAWGNSNEFHKGVDISRENFSAYPEIVASDGGEVIQAGNDGDGYGLCVRILHDDGTITRYAHCSELNVKVGAKVAQGEVLGVMGQTGAATGVHLHFEIIVDGIIVDPGSYLDLPKEY